VATDDIADAIIFVIILNVMWNYKEKGVLIWKI